MGGVYQARGFAWLSKKDYDRAIKDFDEAIRLDPKDACAYVNRGCAWLNLREYKSEIKDYNAAVCLDPNGVEAYWRLAHALATCPEKNLRDPELAIQMATKGCELTSWKTSRELTILAEAYYEVSLFEEAARYAQMALQDPECSNEFRELLEFYIKNDIRDRCSSHCFASVESGKTLRSG